MPTIRPHGRGFEAIVRRKKLHPKPITSTHDTYPQAERWAAELEALLDQGVLPDWLLQEQQQKEALTPKSSLGQLLRQYERRNSVSPSDQSLLRTLYDELHALELARITYPWVEHWVAQLKHNKRLAPGTIRHRVGALARALDWAIRMGYLAHNPLRLLPKGYARYNDSDTAKAGVRREDQERDRRLERHEEEAIRAVIRGEYDYRPAQRPLALAQREAFALALELALETAMRMREAYQVTWGQVNYRQRTLFLLRHQTKNGKARQIPMSSVITQQLQAYFDRHPGEDGARILPFWDGDAQSLDATTARISKQWSRIFAHAGCADLTFHDLRHEATSRFYERTQLSDVEIASITGHTSLRMLQRYANLRGSHLAQALW